MEKRDLGKTGLKTTIVGFGGFHLIEIPQSEATDLLNRYLDKGGNYIETARSYGNGLSEIRIGRAIAHRREEFILASKCEERSRAEAARSIEESLKTLKTDRLDILYMHHVQTIDEANQVMASGGALEAAEEARAQGKVRFIGISAHGQPDSLLYAIQQYSFDVLMTVFNYYDRFNYPKTERVLIPNCLKAGIGIVGMKGLADGYLFRSLEPAIRFALSLPISTLVLGANRREYLERDLEIASAFKAMTNEETEALYKVAPELGDYVCRLCKKCKDKDGFEPYLVFMLEGMYDRQMDDRRLPSTEAYALRERLKFWFRQSERAQTIYRILLERVNPNKDYSYLNGLCPYGIDIDRKLKLAHSKLSDDGYIF
ncbi:MAG TPA: aldo/keto reductase [Spirochaetia bacterium]|nr:aldo/keto reductase [Spirochaetia bacterium]